MKARFAFAFAALVAAACGSSPVPPSQNVIENFPPAGQTDVIAVGGVSRIWAFTVANTGEYTVTITSMNPPATFSTVVVGLRNSDGACAGYIAQNPYAQTGVAAAYGPITLKGSYCVYIQDSGYFTGPETYNLKVSHP
jgi:hypothetical protein